MIRSVCVAAVFVVAAVGCGGNVKQVSCVSRDWNQVGYDTAMSGRTVRTFDNLSSGCEAAPDEAAKSAYLDGYTRGVLEYCTADNGYKMGAANHKPTEICPLEIRAAYAKGYQQGQLEHREAIQGMKRATEEAERRASMQGAMQQENPSGRE